MVDGVFGRPGPIARGHVEQEFRAQRDRAMTQSKLSAQSFLTFDVLTTLGSLLYENVICRWHSKTDT